MRTLILCLDSPLEASAFRSVLEAWGHGVVMCWAGSKAQAIDSLHESSVNDVLIISAHGDADGLIAPEVSPELVDKLGDSRLTWFNIKNLEHSLPKTIISTACCTGSPEFGKAVLDCGASVYVAPEEYPEGAAVFMYGQVFLYRLLQGYSHEDAHSLAIEVSGCNTMRMYKSTS